MQWMVTILSIVVGLLEFLLCCKEVTPRDSKLEAAIIARQWQKFNAFRKSKHQITRLETKEISR